MGQGIRTTMPMIIADEMEADWAHCRVAQADGDEAKYGTQNTDGSTSIRDFLSKYREAGATVRALFEDAAAKEWNVSANDVHARQHTVVHAPTGRTKTFAALVATARTIAMPAKERVRIKRPDERRWQGKKMPSIDLVPMTTGTAVYGADVILPGMKTAVIARPPVWGGKVVRVDDSAALKIPGVERVVRMPEAKMPAGFLPVGGVAVVATNTWAAMKGRDALKITWDDGANASYDSAAYKSSLLEAVRVPGKAGRTNGDAAQALASAKRKVTAEYYVPHLSHAQMEPMVAVARVQGGAIEAWAPTQSPQDARKSIAEYLKVDVAAVTVHVTLLGGGFGRKSKPDCVCEAAYLAREIGAPVRVQWTREDDLKNSYYHSVAAHRLEAGLDSTSKVTAWLHRSAYPAIGATFAPNVPSADADELTNGASDIPFDISNMSVEICPAAAHTRIGWFRSVNAIHHGFAIGSFVDELAHAAGKDSAEFLMALIGGDRQVDLSKAGLVAPGEQLRLVVDRLPARRRSRASRRAGGGREERMEGQAPAREGTRHRDAPELSVVRGDGGRGRGAGRRHGARAARYRRGGCRLRGQPRSRQGADGRRVDHGDEQHALQRDHVRQRARDAEQLRQLRRHSAARRAARRRRAHRGERGASGRHRRAGRAAGRGRARQCDLCGDRRAGA